MTAADFKNIDFGIVNYVAACNQMGNNIILYDSDLDDADLNLEKCEIWKLDIEESTKTNISAVKFRRNTVFGDIVAVAASGGLAGIYSFPKGKCLWSVEYCGDNPHSIEIFPNGAIATICSTGSEIRLYDTDSSLYKSYYSFDGHGLLWDPVFNTLWALSSEKLTAYEFTAEGKGGSLKEKAVYALPDKNGHDLTADMQDKNRLFLTTGQSVYTFCKANGKFFEMPDAVNCKNCKGYGNNKLGNIFYCFPNGGEGMPWENASYRPWCTNEIYFYDRKKEKLYRYSSDKYAYYKVFAFYGEYQ